METHTGHEDQAHVSGFHGNQKGEVEPTVSLMTLFSFADRLDHVLILTGTLSALAHGAAFPIYFIFFGKIVNAFGLYPNNIPEMLQEIQKYALYLFYFGLCVWGAAWTEIACWMYSGERQIGRMRVKYLEAMLKQDIGFFDTDAQAQRFVDSISCDTLLVQEAISEKVGNFLYNMGTFASGIAISSLADWRLCLVTMASVPAMALAGMLYMQTIAQLALKSQASYGDAGAIAQQAIAQIRTVKAFAGENNAARSYTDALKGTLALGYRVGLAKGFGIGTTFLLIFWTWALVLWYASVVIRQGKTNRASAVTALFAGTMCGMALGQALNNFSAFAKGRAAAYPIMQLTNRTPEILNKVPAPTVLSVVSGDLELRNVAFSYPSRPDVMIFTDFSLRVPAGKSVAVVGSSGSGKSTLVSLLERFYDPNDGQILLDGVDIRTLELHWLRNQLGLVNQEPALFTTTILENIRYGKQDATMEEVEEAARAANAETFIKELPDKYSTQVGERGVQLSGGQKQRVAIARAILKNPKILLLDEATSALDAAAERAVQDALDRLMVGRTSVVIAHRLSTIRCVHTIAVLEEGNLLEIGSHEELIAKGDSYASLFRLQQLAFLAEGPGELPNDDGDHTSPTLVPTIPTWPKPSTVFQIEKETPAPDYHTEDQSVTSPTSGSFLRLARLNAPEWKYATVGAIGAVLCGLRSPLSGVLLSKALTALYFTNLLKMDREIHKLSLSFVCVGILSPAFQCLQHYFFGMVSENLTLRVREMMFKTILENEVGWFDEEANNSSRLAARLATDATQVRGAVGDRASLVFQNMAVFTTSSVIALYLQWQIALVLLGVLPMLIVAHAGQLLLARGFAGDLASAHAEGSMIAGEAVSNIRTVAAFNAESKVVELVSRAQTGPARRSVWRGNVAGCTVGAAQVVVFASYGAALWVGSKLVAHGSASFERVMTAFFVQVFMSMAVAETLALSPDVAKADTAVRSVFEILDRKSAIATEDPTLPCLPAVNGEIEFRNVTFAYPTRPTVGVFQNFSLHVNAGQSLALAGPSGSGKSSVLALLLRFYDPTTGCVMIDGLDVKTVNAQSIRQSIGVVPQEPALFTGSIRENIVLGRPDASEAEVQAACRIAHAHQFISSLPGGYSTKVGSGGTQLSGGQRQRVAIARAVLKDPAILLLDEATSSLDAESEDAVQQALQHIVDRRTTIVVAHRLSSIRHVSSIAVVQGGRVVQQGSHSELMEDGSGPYARLVNLQLFPLAH